jgi:hypothetical protein
MTMKKFGASVTLAVAAGAAFVALSADVYARQAPDLSGRWSREAASGTTATPDPVAWPPQMEMMQAGVDLTVQPVSGKPQRFTLNGMESAEVIEVKGCANKTRITKAVADRDKVTITTWLTVKGNCFHGEVDEEPIVPGVGPIEVRSVLGIRKLESITVLYRDGETLTVESTRSTPESGPSTTTSTYRRQPGR